MAYPEDKEEGIPGSGLPDLANLPPLNYKAPPAPKKEDYSDPAWKFEAAAPTADYSDPAWKFEPAAPPQREMGLGEEVKREFKGGVYTLGSSAAEGVGRLIDSEPLRQYGRELGAKREAETAPLAPMEIDYTDPRFLARSTASLLGSTAAPLVAGGAAALAAPAFGLGAGGAALLAAGVSGAAQLPASMGEVSQEYTEATGQDISKGKMVGYGAAHAGLGTIANLATLKVGGLIPGGKSIMGKMASRIVDPWWKTVGKTAVAGGIGQSLEEAGQKLISGAPVAEARGESPFSTARLAEAKQEFLYALPGSILLGGAAGGVGAVKAKSDLKTLAGAVQNPEARRRVAMIVAQELEAGGRKDLADAWAVSAEEHIASKKKLPLLDANGVNEFATKELERRGDIEIPKSEREKTTAKMPEVAIERPEAPGLDMLGAEETGSTATPQTELEAIKEQQERIAGSRDLLGTTAEDTTPRGRHQGEAWDKARTELTSLGLDPAIVDTPGQTLKSTRKVIADAKRAKSKADRSAAAQSRKIEAPTPTISEANAPKIEAAATPDTLDASARHPQAMTTGEGQLSVTAPPPAIIKNAPSIKVYRGVPAGTEDRAGATTFYTTDPSFAATFHQAYAGTGAADVKEASISPQNLFDFRDTNDLVNIMPEVIEKAGGAVAQQLQRGIELGDWGAIEHPVVREAIKNAGYDAFLEAESGAMNIGVINDSDEVVVKASAKAKRPAISVKRYRRQRGESEMVDVELDPNDTAAKVASEYDVYESTINGAGSAIVLPRGYEVPKFNSLADAEAAIDEYEGRLAQKYYGKKYWPPSKILELLQGSATGGMIGSYEGVESPLSPQEVLHLRAINAARGRFYANERSSAVGAVVREVGDTKIGPEKVREIVAEIYDNNESMRNVHGVKAVSPEQQATIVEDVWNSVAWALDLPSDFLALREAMDIYSGRAGTQYVNYHGKVKAAVSDTIKITDALGLTGPSTERLQSMQRVALGDGTAKASPKQDRAAADAIKQQMVAERPKIERRIPEGATRRNLIDRAIAEQREIGGQRATISQLMAMDETKLRELVLSEPAVRASAKPTTKDDLALVRDAHTKQFGVSAENAEDIVEYTGKLNLEQRVAKSVSEALGLKLIYAINMEVDGVSLGNNTIVIDKNNSRPVMFLFGHEAFHSILRSIRASGSQNLNAELDSFIKFVTSAYSPQDRAKWEAKRVREMSQAGLSTEDRAVIDEEFWADVFGRAVHSPDFLPRLRAKDAALYKKFVAAIRDAVDRILRAIGVAPSTTEDAAISAFYKDAEPTPEGVRRAIDATVNLVSAYARERGGATESGKSAGAKASARPTPMPKQPVGGETVTPTWDLPEDSAWTRRIAKYVDKFVDTTNAVKAIRESIDADLEEHIDPELQLTVMPGASTTMRLNFEKSELLPAMEFMKDNSIEFDEMEKHLLMAHAGTANANIAKINPEMQDGGSGVWNDEIREYYDSLDPDRQKTLDEAAGMFHAIRKNLRELLVRSGLESRKTIQRWEAANGKEAVPLHREDMEDPFGGSGTGRGIDTRGPFSQRRLGSELPPVNIIGHLVEERERAIERASKNRSSLATYGMFTMYPAPQVAISVNPELGKAGLTKSRVVNGLMRETGMSKADAGNVWNAAGRDRDAFFDEVVNMGYTDEQAFNAWDSAIQEYIHTNPTMQRQIMALTDAGLDYEEATYIFAPPRNRYYNKATKQVDYRVNPRILDRDNVLATRINGENRYVIFNARNPVAVRMVKNMKNMDGSQLGEWMGTANKVTRFIAAMATQYDPLFGPFNAMRDMGAMSLNLTATPLAGQQAKILRSIPKMAFGLWGELRKERAGVAPSTPLAQLAARFEAAGGRTGFRDSFENKQARIEDVRKQFERMKGKDLKSMFLKSKDSIGGVLSDWNDMFENSTRLAVFKAALDSGMSDARAAKLAKEITVNFNRKGTASNQIGALYAFFNAAVQGTSMMARTLKGPAGRRIVLGGVILGALQSAMLAAAGYDDDDLGAWVKDRSLVIPNFFGDKKKYAAIPYPLGWNIFPALGRNIMDMYFYGPDTFLQKFAPNTMLALADALNPLGSVGKSAQVLTPTAVDPLVALGENRDYAGRPIAKEDYNSLRETPGYMRSKDTASGISVGVAKLINMVTGAGLANYGKGALSPTPDQIDYLISQAFGGVGRSAVKVGKAFEAVKTGEEIPTYAIPVLGRLYGNIGESYNESNRFYSNLREMQNHRLELEGRRGERKPVQGYLDRNPTARLVGASEDAYKDVSEMVAERKQARARGASQERIKAIDKRIQNRMRRFNDLIKRTEGRE